MFKLQVEKETTLLFKVAFKYFAVKLELTQDEVDLISVKIDSGKGLNSKLSSDIHGACIGRYDLNDGELLGIDIYVKQQANLGLIETLAHEMVHARQNLRGEFSINYKIEKFLYIFDVIKVERVHAGQDLNNTPYYEQKCEQEAFEMSRELTRQFLNFFYLLEKNYVQDMAIKEET